MAYSDICVVDNMVCMGTVNNSNMTWHVLICVVSNNSKALSWILTRTLCSAHYSLYTTNKPKLLEHEQ